MTLHVMIVDLLTSVQFKVEENLAIDVLPVTAFVDHHIPTILQREQKVAPRESTPVAIFKE